MAPTVAPITLQRWPGTVPRGVRVASSSTGSAVSTSAVSWSTSAGRVDRLGQGVVERVPDATDRGDRADLGEPFAFAHRHEPRPGIAVTPQPVQPGAARPAGHLHGVEHQGVRMCAATRHPTIMRENASRVKHRWAGYRRTGVLHVDSVSCSEGGESIAVSLAEGVELPGSVAAGEGHHLQHGLDGQAGRDEPDLLLQPDDPNCHRRYVTEGRQRRSGPQRRRSRHVSGRAGRAEPACAASARPRGRD